MSGFVELGSKMAESAGSRAWCPAGRPSTPTIIRVTPPTRAAPTADANDHPVQSFLNQPHAAACCTHLVQGRLRVLRLGQHLQRRLVRRVLERVAARKVHHVPKRVLQPLSEPCALRVRLAAGVRHGCWLRALSGGGRVGGWRVWVVCCRVLSWLRSNARRIGRPRVLSPAVLCRRGGGGLEAGSGPRRDVGASGQAAAPTSRAHQTRPGTALGLPYITFGHISCDDALLVATFASMRPSRPKRGCAAAADQRSRKRAHLCSDAPTRVQR
jgi:hypothetical protein